MVQKYYSILTDVGVAAVANAAALGNKVNITQFAVGNGAGTYYQPTSDMTDLKHEDWRGNVTNVEIDQVSPNIITVTGVITSDVGGFTIREMGLFDSSGKLIAVANTPDTAKVVIKDGTSSEMQIKIQLAVSNADVIKLTVDPTVIIMTKADLAKHTENLNNPHKVNAADVGASNPNLLINGDFRINQRAQAVYCGLSYTLDRWNVGGDCSAVAQRYDAGTSSNYAEITTTTVTTAFCNFQQILEDTLVNGTKSELGGKTVTASAWCNTNGKKRGLFIGYVADGASQYTWTATRLVQNATLKSYSVTVAIPIGASRLRVGLGTCDALSAEDANTWVTIRDCKLEVGSVATPFVPRPYAEELAMCQRYYETLDNYLVLTNLGSLEARQTVQFKTRKRVSPTLIIISPNGIIGKVGKYNGTTWNDFSYDSDFISDTNFDKYTIQITGFTDTCYFMWSMKADAEIY